MALSTGAREGEIAALEFKHVDFDKNTIRIEQSITSAKGQGVILKDTKSERERTVSIPKPLTEMLKKLHTERKKEKLKLEIYWNGKNIYLYLQMNLESRSAQIPFISGGAGLQKNME